MRYRICLNGLEWLYSKEFEAVTSEKWKDKFGVSFETARKDLMWLKEHGYLAARQQGHKVFFDVIRSM